MFMRTQVSRKTDFAIHPFSRNHLNATTHMVLASCHDIVLNFILAVRHTTHASCYMLQLCFGFVCFSAVDLLRDHSRPVSPVQHMWVCAHRSARIFRVTAAECMPISWWFPGPYAHHCFHGCHMRSKFTSETVRRPDPVLGFDIWLQQRTVSLQICFGAGSGNLTIKRR